MRAKSKFIGVSKIPNGSTLKVRSKDIEGDVQGHGGFFDGSTAEQDVEWANFTQVSNGEAEIAGPAISMVRLLFRLGAGASVRIDITIEHDGEEIRNRFWELEAPDDASNTERIILTIGVLP